MRDFNEIVEELKNHPDYCYSEIWCWSDIVDEINESNELDIVISDLSESQRQEIKDAIVYTLTSNYEYCTIIPTMYYENNELKIKF